MYISQLTFTRFLASISIVILHFGLFSWPINSDGLFPFFVRSASAVSYFFILSGFILVIASSRGGVIPNKVNTLQFWMKRGARILPIYLFSVLLFFAMNFKYDASIPLEWQTKPYYYSIFLLQSWKHQMALDINYPAWSLSVEAFFYFIFPLLFRLLNYLKAKWLLILSFIFWVGNSSLFYYLKQIDAPENFSKFYPPLHLATFIIGICSGIIFVKYKDWFRGKNIQKIHAFTIGTGILLLVAAYGNWSFYTYQHNGLLAPFFILVFYSLSLLKGKVANILSWKPLIFLGDISYSIYLFQYPVMQICERYIPWLKGKERADIFFQYLIILIIFSSFSYLLIEKPVRQFITKRFIHKKLIPVKSDYPND